MKTFLFISILFLSSCTGTYDTLEYRNREFKKNEVLLSTNNLSSEQIKQILNTKIADSFPVDVSILIYKDYYINSNDEFNFAKSIITHLKESKKIERVVPIPKIIVPDKLDFSTIQELGVRSLTEYIILFDFSSDSYFNFHFFKPTEVTVISDIDYLIIDSQTGAIIATDRLISEEKYQRQTFSRENQEEAKKTLFIKQSEKLAIKIAELFQTK